jgi:hypothetical protein
VSSGDRGRVIANIEAGVKASPHCERDAPATITTDAAICLLLYPIVYSMEIIASEEENCFVRGFCVPLSWPTFL